MNSKEWVEVQAPTVEEAIILGLTRLGITRDGAQIEVLDEGSQGFLGLGAREARVRIKRREQKSEDPASKIEDVHSEGETSTVAPPRKEEGVSATKPSPEKAAVDEETKVAPPEPPQATGDEPKSRPEPAPTPTPKSSGEDPREQIEAVVLDVAKHLFGALDVEPKIVWREEEKRPALWLSLEGEDARALVGQKGKTLNAAQFLTRVLVRNQIDGNFNLVVDADNYRWRHYKKLRRLAKKAAKKALSSGQPVRMHPMPARERRIVHMTLRKDRRVRTKSYGSGRGRAVTVFPVDGNR